MTGLGFRTALYLRAGEAVMSKAVPDEDEAKRMLDNIQLKYPHYPCEVLQVIERREKS